MQTLSLSQWMSYRDILEKIDKKAADEYRDAVWRRGGEFNGVGLGKISAQELTDYAYALVTKYGEASAAAAAEAYDEIAALQKVDILPAVPAPTATYDETAQMVNGILKKSQNVDMLASGVSRLVKQAGADTTLKNAYRDRKPTKGKNKHSGAEFAWIPSGDTCPYCIGLASQGWKSQTEWAEKYHAEHIHANCDCVYMVRFKKDLNYAGYNPDYYTEMINEQAKKQGIINENETVDDVFEGKGQELNEDVLNAMRRENYKVNKEKILAQKKSAYEKRKELNSSQAEEENVN